MIESDWKRIAGIECLDDGTLAAVWFAHDRQSDCIHLYDACLFCREVLAVIAESISARGRWIPVAWEKKSGKAMADKLLERGINMTYEPYEESDAVAETVSRDIWERMRGGRFKVDKRLAEWLDEYKSFQRQDNKIPRSSHPLMTATRIAMASFDEWGRAERLPGAERKNHPGIAVV